MKKRRRKQFFGGLLYSGVIGEKHFNSKDFICKNSDPAHKFAKKRLENPTNAERKFEQILNTVDNGFFVGKFKRERAICGKWILDFYFPKYRLAIEIDGKYHESLPQIEKDCQKAEDCKKLEIVLIRLSNQQVFGKLNDLIEELNRNKVKVPLSCREFFEHFELNNRIPKLELTEYEQALILRHFEFYKSLANGKRKPVSDDQLHFVQMCLGLVAPKSEHEIAFAKFIRIKAKEFSVIKTAETTHKK